MTFKQDTMLYFNVHHGRLSCIMINMNHSLQLIQTSLSLMKGIHRISFEYWSKEVERGKETSVELTVHH